MEGLKGLSIKQSHTFSMQCGLPHDLSVAFLRAWQENIN